MFREIVLKEPIHVLIVYVTVECKNVEIVFIIIILRTCINYYLMPTNKYVCTSKDLSKYCENSCSIHYSQLMCDIQ